MERKAVRLDMVEHETKKPIISSKLFKVRVPRLTTYTEEDMLYGSFDRRYINGRQVDVDEELVTVMITVDRMVEVFNMGYGIKVIDHSDVNEIYSIVEKYIRGNDGTTDTISVNTASPEDRLEELNDFADSIFGLNKASLLKDAIVSSNSFTPDKHMFSTGFAGSGNMGKKPLMKTKTLEELRLERDGKTYLGDIDIESIRR